ncbi:MAG: nucleotidyltransferase family protein [Chloroflexi bacterium]|nr:nucleotidyltransferase family protein [Chloroflexota bacterium]
MSSPFVSAVLLAAGESTRMGEQKAMLPWDGVTLLEWQVKALLEAGVAQLVVVLGYRAERLRPLVAGAPGVQTVLNLRYRTGKSSSVRAGLRHVDPRAEAILVLAVDQPRPPYLIRRVLEAHLQGTSLITYPAYKGKGGHPVVFSASLLPEMLRVRESRQGLREVVERHRAEVLRIPMDDPQVAMDLNTRDDYERAVTQRAAGN